MDLDRTIALVLLSFVCGLIDSSLGMGYGTTLTPILLALGLEPIAIVPAVLLAEAGDGLVAAVFHHSYGNVDFRSNSTDLRVAAVLIGFSIVGVLVAVSIAVRLPAWVIRLYIGLLVLVLGMAVLLHRRRELRFSWGRIAGLGSLAAFNKGISGGGYGPVVTAGQMLAGVRARNAVGVAALAEGITSVAGVLFYIASGTPIPWEIALALVVGAVLSVPPAVLVVSRLPTARLTVLIGGLSVALGGYTLLRLFV